MSSAASIAQPAPAVTETDIPARLDRLPWGRFHSLVVGALGITWVLDGLEVTLAGAVAGAMKESPALALNNAQVSAASSAYLIGCVLGGLFFGWLTDRLGRKKLFSITLLVYLAATAATAFSWNFPSLLLFRFITGAGIGGEYVAINSTIQELIPARARGWVTLVINGSYWLGAALGAVGSVVLLDPALLGPDLGWRASFFTGAILGLFILFLRRAIPESPRWLMTHGRVADGEAIVTRIEDGIRAQGHTLPPAGPPVRLRELAPVSTGAVARSLLRDYGPRTVLGLSLMTAQAFFYNAIFFTEALVLTSFFGVPANDVGWYILPFAAGNFLGPLLIGRFFDTIGRVPMIAGTYALSGVLLIGTGVLFQQGLLTATTITLAWSVIFFFASAAASSAYLTVSECFPLEIRAVAISLFFAFGTGVGGVCGPLVFGALIDTGSRTNVLWGYVLGAGLMIAAAAVEAVLGVKAEGKSLEDIAAPLSTTPIPDADNRRNHQRRQTVTPSDLACPYTRKA